jgi:serine/threonine protein kinase
MITFACPHCDATLRVDDSMAGRSGACPGCSSVVQIPAAAERASGQRTLHPSSAAEDTASPFPDSLDLAPSPDFPFLASPQEADELGRLGPYRVLKVLGTGAMGVVFQAEDPHLKRMVALKVMRPTLAASAEYHRRFLREARLSASIDHEHIVTTYQVGEDRGVPFLAMQMLQGETLEDRLNRAGGRLPLAEVLRVGREIAEGLGAAHARGLIHRDVKPANVWLEKDRGRVRIVDFGLARGSEPDAQFTQAGAVIGTPAYMAPEQARGEEVDARSDLFSLGAVLYRAATGEAPFGGKDTLSVLNALATRTPTPPHRIVASLPRLFSGLVMRLLAKDPEDRPQSASEVVEAVEALERGDADEAAAEPIAEAPRPPARTKAQPAAPAAPALRSGGKKSKGPSARQPRAKKRPPTRKDWGPLVLTVGVALLVIAALFLVLLLLLHAR